MVIKHYSRNRCHIYRILHICIQPYYDRGCAEPSKGSSDHSWYGYARMLTEVNPPSLNTPEIITQSHQYVNNRVRRGKAQNALAPNNSGWAILDRS